METKGLCILPYMLTSTFFSTHTLDAIILAYDNSGESMLTFIGNKLDR